TVAGHNSMQSSSRPSVQIAATTLNRLRARSAGSAIPWPSGIRRLSPRKAMIRRLDDPIRSSRPNFCSIHKLATKSHLLLRLLARWTPLSRNGCPRRFLPGPMRDYELKSGHGPLTHQVLRKCRSFCRSAAMQQQSDRELVAALAGSHRTTALGECLARYGQMVQRTARRIANDQHLAEDVCQAVLLVLLRKAGRLGQV